MEWVAYSITSKGLHLLTEPHQSSQPQMSCLMSHPAVGVDVVNPSFITSPERII